MISTADNSFKYGRSTNQGAVSVLISVIRGNLAYVRCEPDLNRRDGRRNVRGISEKWSLITRMDTERADLFFRITRPAGPRLRPSAAGDKFPEWQHPWS